MPATKEQHDVGATLAKLPEWCFVFIPGMPAGQRIGKVMRGVPDYWPIHHIDKANWSNERARAFVRELNEHIATELQQLCMENGSMFGWHLPGADPDHMQAIIEKRDDRARRAGL